MEKETIWNRISIDPKLAKPLFWSLWLVMVVCLLFWQLWATGFRFNVTPSLPRGVYRLTTERPTAGDLVSFCLDEKNSTLALEREYLESGSCPTGSRSLLKKLAGFPGDQVVQTEAGISVNGLLWPNTAFSHADNQARPMPAVPLTGSIPAGMALVLSDLHAGSFDSRYFGLVPLASLHKVNTILLFQ